MNNHHEAIRVYAKPDPLLRMLKQILPHIHSTYAELRWAELKRTRTLFSRSSQSKKG